MVVGTPRDVSRAVSGRGHVIWLDDMSEGYLPLRRVHEQVVLTHHFPSCCVERVWVICAAQGYAGHSDTCRNLFAELPFPFEEEGFARLSIHESSEVWFGNLQHQSTGVVERNVHSVQVGQELGGWVQRDLGHFDFRYSSSLGHLAVPFYLRY